MADFTTLASFPAHLSDLLSPNRVPLDRAVSDPLLKLSPAAAVSSQLVPEAEMSHDHPTTAPATALLHPEPLRSVHDDDDDDDAGGVDEERGPQAAKYDSHDVDKQGENNSREEEAGEVTEGSEKAVSGYAAKGFAAHGDQLVEEEVDGGEGLEEEAKKKRRPGRPRKKSVDGEVGEFVNTPKRARPSAEKIEAISFAADRPTRERKSIDRFIASAEKENTKELHIRQGGGTLLKDIPNVVFKISKRYKHDETLSQLHSVLFNKRGKAAVLKQHILQFSGFVWGDNQEKERAKVQEKLERFTKDSLVQFVDVLDVHVSRTLKKEYLVARVLEFLEKPYQTTDTLLELKKQERRISGKGSSSGKRQGRPKIQKVGVKTSRNRDKRNASEVGASDESEKCIDNELLEEEVEQKRLNFKDDTDHEELPMEEEKKRAKGSSTIIKQDIEEKVAEKEGNQEDNEVAVPPRKKCKVEAHDVTFMTPSKTADRVYSKKSLPTSGKKDAKSATRENEKGKKSYVKRRNSTKTKIPSDRELQAKIRELLTEADFSKVTFTDVVSQLERIFEVSLVEQKGHVKGLIRDEISKLTELDDECRDEEAATAAVKDE